MDETRRLEAVRALDAIHDGLRRDRVAEVS
jgi:hypothetical protein